MTATSKWALAAALALATAPAWGQTLTGSITGTVKDEQGAALPGASVTLIGRTGERSVTTDAKGSYRFPTVDPGAYAVKAELAQFQPQQKEQLAIEIGLVLTVDFTLKVAGISETMEVVGQSALVDVTSSATSESLSQDLLFNLPLNRFAPELLNYTPGIHDDSAFGGGDSANGFYLDGVSTRSPGGGSDYVYMNYNIIDEFQVQGLGAPAEYGNFTGAVINYVSKSGGNHFSALFDVQYSTGGLSSDNTTPEITSQNPTLGEPQKTNTFLDMTAQVGGPIIKDKLFFFLSAQRYRLDVDPPGPRQSLNEVTPRLNAKLTWQPGSSDTVTAAFQGEDYNITGRRNFKPGELATTDALSTNLDGPDRLWSLQWRHVFGSRTFLETKYHGYTSKAYVDPKVNEPLHYDYTSGQYSGGGGYYSYADRNQQTLNASLSHYADWYGQHDLKFGVEIERSRTRDRFGYTGGFYYYDYNGPYRAYSYSYDVTGDNHRESFFVQDTWKVNGRLTINPGVRVDRLRGLRADNGEVVYSNTNVAPRLGIAFDVTGDHKTVARAFYGQYYEALLEYQYSRLLPGTSDFVTYDVSSGTPVEIDRDPLSNSAYRFDPNVKHPKVDEFMLAFERALAPQLRLSVTGVLRDNKNFIGSVIPSARWTPTTVDNSLTGQPLTVYTWTNKDSSANDLLITNPDGFQFRDPSGNVIGTTEASGHYRALIATLEKRLSNRWQAKLSYVLSKNSGTVDPFSNEHIGYGRQFETPTLALVNSYGSFIGSRPHELKLFATYQIPRIELNFNAYYRLISGSTWTPYQRYSSSEINFSSVLGREPWIAPLGSFRMPTENLLDLRLEKTFAVHGTRVGLYADIFNVFNKSLINDVQNRYPSASVEGFSVDGGAPASLVEPRQVTFGVRWSF